MASNPHVYQQILDEAEAFLTQDKWSDAVKLYHSVLKTDPDIVPALIGLAHAYFGLAQYQSTVRALQRALKLQPANQSAISQMARVFQHLNRDDQAAKTYVYAGNLLAKRGNLTQAVENWQQAVDIDPNQLQARNNLAQAYIRLGEKESAVEELILLAVRFQSDGNDAKARQYLQGAQRLMPTHKMLNIAQSAFDKGEPIDVATQSAAHLEEQQLAEDVRSANLEEESLLSFVEMDEDEEESAANPREVVEEQALGELANVLFEDDLSGSNSGIDKNAIDLLIGLAIDLQTRGRNQEAIDTFEKLLQAGFNRPAVYFMLASMNLKIGNYDEAITYYNRAKPQRTYLQGLNFALGECYRKKHDLNNALRYFVEVMRLIDMGQAQREGTRELNMVYQDLIDNYVTQNNPKNTQSLVDSLLKFLSHRDYEQSILNARQQLGDGDGASVGAWVEFLETPNTEITLSVMSETAQLIEQKMYISATETCYRAIQRAPFYLPLHLRLAEIYHKQDETESSLEKYLKVADVYYVRGNMRRVEEIYYKILDLAPMDITVRTKLIELYKERDNIDEALTQYQILADAHYQLAQINQALETYQTALDLVDRAQNPLKWRVDLLHHIADIYMQRVDWLSAKNIYEQIVRIVPDDIQAAQYLIDLYFKLNQKPYAQAMLQRVAAIYAEQGQPENMTNFLKNLLQLRPRENSLRQQLAARYEKSNMQKEAIEQYDMLGELQLEAGLRDDAVRTIKKILSLNPDDPAGYNKLLTKIMQGI